MSDTIYDKPKKKQLDTNFFVIKNSFDSCFRDIDIKMSKDSRDSSLNIIKDAVFRVNIIVTHSYFFLKLYFLYLYIHKQDFPIIDENFILCIMKVVSIKFETRGGKLKKSNKKLISELSIFYNNYYYRITDLFKLTNCDKLTQILTFEADQIVTSVETNIKEHFIQHVNKFIKYFFNFKDRYDEIYNDTDLTSKEHSHAMYLLRLEFRNILKDILETKPNNDLLSLPKYHKWIKDNKWKIIPKKMSIKRIIFIMM